MSEGEERTADPQDWAPQATGGHVTGPPDTGPQERGPQATGRQERGPQVMFEGQDPRTVDPEQALGEDPGGYSEASAETAGEGQYADATEGEATYPEWWQDYEREAGWTQTQAAEQDYERDLYDQQAASQSAQQSARGLLSDADRHAVADLLYGQLRGDESEEYRAARLEGVKQAERAFAESVKDRVQGATQRLMADRAVRHAAATNVRQGWGLLLQHAPELAQISRPEDQQDVIELAEGVLLRRGYGTPEGTLDIAKMATISPGELGEVVEAVRDRAQRLLWGRGSASHHSGYGGWGQAPAAPQAPAMTPAPAPVHSRGFAERPAPTRPDYLSRRSVGAEDPAFFEGLSVTAPPTT